MNNPAKMVAIAVTIAMIFAGLTLAVTDSSSADGDPSQSVSDTKYGNYITWSYDASSKTLKISYENETETGTVPSGDQNPPWTYLSGDVEVLEIKNFHNIGARAFLNFEALMTIVNQPIDEVTGLKTVVTNIGAHAFDGCSKLSNVIDIITMAF